MHTVRNRIASRPPTTKAALADFKPLASRTSRQELTLIARGSTLPENQMMPCSFAGERTAENRPRKRRNPKGKKARKAAARKAEAAAVTVTSPALTAKARQRKSRSGKQRPGGPTPPPAQPPTHHLSELEPGTTRDLCPQAEPAPAVLLLSKPEPLVQAPASVAPTEPVHSPETAAAHAPLPALPDRPERLAEPPVELPAPVANAAQPLPRSRALVPARRQGLVDVIKFLLRDSGRRLARWSARRHQTRAEQAALRQAEARQINLQRELEAIDALRRNRS